MEHVRTIEWTTVEHEHRERSVDWHWTVGVISGAAAIASFVLNNFLFGVFWIIAGFTIMMLGSKHPSQVHCLLDERGIHINGQFISYGKIKSFWIHKNFLPQRLVLDIRRPLVSDIIINMGDGHQTDSVRIFLLRFLPEKEHVFSITEAISERLGF